MDQKEYQLWKDWLDTCPVDFRHSESPSYPNEETIIFEFKPVWWNKS